MEQILNVFLYGNGFSSIVWDGNYLRRMHYFGRVSDFSLHRPVVFRLAYRLI